MPRYQAHLWCNAFVYMMVMTFIAHYHFRLPATYIELLLCSSLGSLFPDIDIKSKGQQISYVILVMLLVCLLCGKQCVVAALVGIFALTPLLVPHRGVFHRLWFITGLTIVMVFVLLQLMPMYHERILVNGIFFLMGATTHLILDGGWRMVTRW
jgi:hypothetical protein